MLSRTPRILQSIHSRRSSRYLISSALSQTTHQSTSRKRFSTSRKWEVRNADLTEADLANVNIDGERLWRELHETCEWGKGARWGEGPTDIGMSRLTLTDSDKQARDWFVETTKSLGCQVHIDAMGNIFAIRPGLKDGPATFAGSHLDTQPTGGRYDGILGVHAGIEALRTMNDLSIETTYPTGVINWTNEEGARFPVSMLASGVWAGKIPLEKAYALTDVSDSTKTFKSELERIGYLGTIPASHETGIPIGAHFELHIEQGPILESLSKKIGVVRGVQAYRWFTITVKGQDCHTGTTDFKNRSDALLTACRLIAHSHKLALQSNCLASTGILKLKPGSTNTVPGWVQFSLDVRSSSTKVLMQLVDELQGDFKHMAQGVSLERLSPQFTQIRKCTGKGSVKSERGTGKDCQVEWQEDSDSSYIKFDNDCIKCVEQSAAAMFSSDQPTTDAPPHLEKSPLQLQSKFDPVPKGPVLSLTEKMISGAGHDSVYASKIAPTSMIFVPCKDGVSHNPAEYCSPEDCRNGAQVLLGSILRYDRLRDRRDGGAVPSMDGSKTAPNSPQPVQGGFWGNFLRRLGRPPVTPIANNT